VSQEKKDGCDPSAGVRLSFSFAYHLSFCFNHLSFLLFCERRKSWRQLESKRESERERARARAQKCVRERERESNRESERE
jgi:hypothetical protein